MHQNFALQTVPFSENSVTNDVIFFHFVCTTHFEVVQGGPVMRWLLKQSTRTGLPLVLTNGDIGQLIEMQ
jgi:hypothetical protein